MVTATASAMTFDLPPLDELTPSTNGHAGEPTSDDLGRLAAVDAAAEAAEAGDELEGEEEEAAGEADTDSQEVGGGIEPEPLAADRPPAYPGEPEPDESDTILHDEADDGCSDDEDPDPITAAREALGEAVLERMALEKQLKRAKKAEKDAAEELRDLVGRQLELPLAVAAPPDLQKSFIDDDPAKEVGAGAEADPNAWRSALVTDLPLKPAILARLEESGIATIGELEDLRAGAGLRSLKGVGQAKTDAIEEAVVVWLSANRDREVFSQVNGAAADKGAN